MGANREYRKRLLVVLTAVGAVGIVIVSYVFDAMFVLCFVGFCVVGIWLVIRLVVWIVRKLFRIDERRNLLSSARDEIQRLRDEVRNLKKTD